MSPSSRAVCAAARSPSTQSASSARSAVCLAPTPPQTICLTVAVRIQSALHVGSAAHNVDPRGQILNLALYVVGEGVTALATTAAAVVDHHEVCSERIRIGPLATRSQIRTSERTLEMFTPIAGRTVLVTGGTKGIGKGIAGVFARAGANVVVNGRDSEAGEAAVRDLSGQGGEVAFVAGDVGRAAHCERLA